MPYISSKKDLWSLVDCNNFYASCERLFRPDLINKPVVVLSNNDGCIVARSEEAKKLGIDMAVPYFKVKKLLEENKVHVFSSNYALYGNISQRVMNTLRSMVDSVEVYSIDEAFIKMDATLSLNAIDMAKTLRKRIQKWVGITTSIGIAETKTLAKLASSLAKKNQGICILKADDKNTELILKNTPAGKIWGIGSKSAEKLRLRGIYTAYQLREADRQMIRSLLSITGLHTC